MFKRFVCWSSVVFVTLSSAHAADVLAVQQTPPLKTAQEFSWSGFYTGVQAGWMRNKVKHGQQTDISYNGGLDGMQMFTYGPYDQYKGNDDQFSGGLFMGYNFQLNRNLLFGLEADINWFNTDESHTEFDDNISLESGSRHWKMEGYRSYYFTREQVKAKRSAALRARLGYTNDRFLAYAAAGLATARIKYNYSYDGFFTDYRETNTDEHSLTGYTVGGGVEYALSKRLLLRSEYRFTDYGSKDFDFTGHFLEEPATFKADYKTHDVRIGLAYKFN